MPSAERNRRQLLLRVGFALLAIGAAPLAIYVAVEAVAGDPDNPGNPVGLGLLFFLLGGPGALCVIIGMSLDKPRTP